MTTKQLANNSMMRRASQFESKSTTNRQQQQQPNNKNKPENISNNSMLSSSLDQEENDKIKCFLKDSFSKFKKEFSSAFPDSKLPFEEFNSIDVAKQLLTTQQKRIDELNKELNRTKFSTNFLEELIVANNNDDENTDSQRNFFSNSNEETENGNCSKEQYVTVITLNDSTYGEIQRQKVPPKSFFKINDNSADNNDENASECLNNKPNNNSNSSGDYISTHKLDCEMTKEKVEPIYLNTLETHKSTDKVSNKKRPPTPPRKPKFNKIQGSSGDIFGSLSSSNSNSLSKSDSLGSISQKFQRKFSGPVQQLSKDDRLNNKENEIPKNDALVHSPSLKEGDSNAKQSYMRTFSLDPQSKTKTNEDNNSEVNGNKNDDGEGMLYHDYDNIYDTVTPDSDCDIDSNDDKPDQLTREEDNETSSHEMLSRSSSTDDGLSNYVNIDYFLRKNSLGRSNSNIPSRLSSKRTGYETDDVEEHEDNETNMSSMKSSDYDNFSSNENLINALQQQQSTSLKSFNSASTNSSTSVSSLKTNILKLINSDLSSSYPPNLSTFTPPIRDRNQPAFFRDSSKIEKEEETTVYSNSLELSKTSKYKSTYNDNSDNNCSAEFYAYTDILHSMPANESKIESADEPISLENKSFDKISGIQDNSINETNQIVDQANLDHSRQMQWSIIRSIIESETIYVDCLKTLIQYMRALNSTTSTGDALLSVEDLNAIFYRIPELYQLHNTFLDGLKIVDHSYKLKNSLADLKFASKLMSKRSIGELFHSLVSSLSIYSDFLRNYSNALVTANRCSANNAKFSDIIKSIKIASLNGQFTNLVGMCTNMQLPINYNLTTFFKSDFCMDIDLLHKPIARLQKNALVLYDLLKYTDPNNEQEQELLKEALKMTQAFLNELNLDATRKLFPASDKFQRRLVKESFIIEHGERRKLRHLFLFNDLIVCAKYKPSSKQKFTSELKWFQMLNDIVLDQNCDSLVSSGSSISNYSMHSSLSHSNSTQSSPQAKEAKDGLNLFNAITNRKLRAASLRCDLLMEEKPRGSTKVGEKIRKKISDLESELVLYLPQLKFSFYVKNNQNKVHIFYLSSEYERNCWIDAIKRMQLSVSLNPSNTEQASLYELQRWIDSCRMSLNLGSFLLRTFKDESLRFGDLYLRLKHLRGFNNKSNLFFVIETDSYGHYFKRAITKYVSSDERSNINQEFLIELEGTQSLRILCYEDVKRNQIVNNNDSYSDSNQCEANERSAVFKGKASFELNTSCLCRDYIPKEIAILDYILLFEMSYISLNSVMKKIPPNKLYGTFGASISHVCKKEKSEVPYLIISCINEVERRGLKEVGIYRVSGLSSDVQRLKRTFETNPRDACWIIREIDIHAVTGLLKLYLRELPESLFTNDMYKKYLEARDLRNLDEKDRKMTSLLSQLVQPNQATVIVLIEHLTLVNRYEEDNKMSLNNLATIFGPTMLRTNSSSNSNNSNSSMKNTSSMSGSSNLQNAHSGNMGANLSSLMINTELFTASTIDVMAQADILYFFLRRKYDGLSLISTDREETSL